VSATRTSHNSRKKPKRRTRDKDVDEYDKARNRHKQESYHACHDSAQFEFKCAGGDTTVRVFDVSCCSCVGNIWLPLTQLTGRPLGTLSNRVECSLLRTCLPLLSTACERLSPSQLNLQLDFLSMLAAVLPAAEVVTLVVHTSWCCSMLVAHAQPTLGLWGLHGWQASLAVHMEPLEAALAQTSLCRLQ
jgi:hypothetical protein